MTATRKNAMGRHGPYRKAPASYDPDTRARARANAAFRWTLDRLLVLAVFDNRGESTTAELSAETSLNPKQISKKVRALENMKYLEAQGRRGLRKIWKITEEGKTAFMHGMRKRFSRRQDWGDPVEFIHAAKEANSDLKAANWYPGPRWEVLRKVPVWLVQHIMDQQGIAKCRNFFAWSFGTLLGVADRIFKHRAPIRPNRESQLVARLWGIARKKRHNNPGFVTAALAAENPIRYALQA